MLDESLILDCMQNKIYENDNKSKTHMALIDKEEPRTHIRSRLWRSVVCQAISIYTWEKKSKIEL